MTKYYYLFKVSIERTFKELIRYKFNTFSNILLLYIVFMAMFLGISAFVGSYPIDIGDSIEGFIVGYFLWTVMMMAYSGISYSLVEDASRGTLEQLNMSSIRLSTIVTVRSISELLVDLLTSIVLLLIIMQTTGYHLHLDIFSIILPIVLGIFSILGIGLVLGGLALIFKKVQSFLNIFQYLLIAMLIISPDNNILYNLIPFRPAADIVFMVMREGYSFVDFSTHYYAILIANSILYFGIGLIVFNKCVDLAKKRGLLGQY